MTGVVLRTASIEAATQAILDAQGGPSAEGHPPRNFEDYTPEGQRVFARHLARAAADAVLGVAAPQLVAAERDAAWKRVEAACDEMWGADWAIGTRDKLRQAVLGEDA